MNLRRTSCALPDPLPWKPFNPFLWQDASSLGLLRRRGSGPCLLSLDPRVLPPGVRWAPSSSQASSAFFSLPGPFPSGSPANSDRSSAAHPFGGSAPSPQHPPGRTTQRAPANGPIGTATVSIREPRALVLIPTCPRASDAGSESVGRGGSEPRWELVRALPLEWAGPGQSSGASSRASVPGVEVLADEKGVSKSFALLGRQAGRKESLPVFIDAKCWCELPQMLGTTPGCRVGRDQD